MWDHEMAVGGQVYSPVGSTPPPTRGKEPSLRTVLDLMGSRDGVDALEPTETFYCRRELNHDGSHSIDWTVLTPYGY
jgi:hypothetical protein